MISHNKISQRGTIVFVDINSKPKTFKELNGFLKLNNAPTCFIKQNNKVWKILPDTTFVYICQNIDQLTFKEYLELSFRNISTNQT